MTMTEPFYVWITGWSCAGKTTLANVLSTELDLRMPPVENIKLDGDVIRTTREAGPISEAGRFTKADRDNNVIRAAQMGRHWLKQGCVPIISLISPYRSTRMAAREILGDRGLLVHLYAPVDVLAARDTSGRYQAALAGNLERFTGITDPYEEPDPILEEPMSINTTFSCAHCCLSRVLDRLQKRGWLSE